MTRGVRKYGSMARLQSKYSLTSIKRLVYFFDGNRMSVCSTIYGGNDVATT